MSKPNFGNKGMSNRYAKNGGKSVQKSLSKNSDKNANGKKANAVKCSCDHKSPKNSDSGNYARLIKKSSNQAIKYSIGNSNNSYGNNNYVNSGFNGKNGKSGRNSAAPISDGINFTSRFLAPTGKVSEENAIYGKSNDSTTTFNLNTSNYGNTKCNNYANQNSDGKGGVGRVVVGKAKDKSTAKELSVFHYFIL